MHVDETYEQEFHYEDVCHQRMDLCHRGTNFAIAYGFEDTKLIFRDVSYDEEPAQPTCHIHK